MDRRILIAFSLILIFIMVSPGETPADGESWSKKSSLPKISFKDAVSSETMKYLGLPRQRKFSLDDIQGTFLVIELFSTYCMSCPKNIPVMNEVYTAVGKDATLRGKIKVFGIAIGNTVKEVESYKKAHHVLFPVVTDYDFIVHDTLGNPRVPYTMFVKRPAKGKTIVESHQGVLDSAETVLKKVRTLN